MDWQPVFEMISWICLLGGGAFLLIGSVGLLRMPDLYTRMHAASLVDTMGAGLVLLGLMFQVSDGMPLIKLVLIGVFLFFTSPTTTHALARAAINDNVTPMEKKPDDVSSPEQKES